MKRFFTVCFLLFIAVCSSYAQVAPMITHQGFLADSAGNGLNGNFAMKFSFYPDSLTGINVGLQSFPSVPVTNGVYSVLLDISALDMSQQYWVETEVGAEILSPRIRLTPVPYAQWTEWSSKLVLPYYGLDTSWMMPVFRVDNWGSSTNGVFGNWSNTNDMPALLAVNDGSGPGLSADNGGTGNAAVFNIESPSNTLPVIVSTGHGSGPAIQAISEGTGKGIEVSVWGNANGIVSSTNGVNGVVGRSFQGGGTGLVGVADSGSAAYGVYGLSDHGYGIVGSSPYGVGGLFSSTSSYGMYASSIDNSALYGQSGGAAATINAHNLGTGPGVTAVSTGAYGVISTSTNDYGIGVSGTANATLFSIGVKGESNLGYGVFGTSTSGIGVYGVTMSGVGLYGYSDNNVGIYAGSNTGTALGCTGKFYMSGGVFEAHPTSTLWTTNKPATVKLTNGDRVKLFAEEATEVYFNDYGQGTLSNGRVHLTLDAKFLQTVTIDNTHPLKVFVQLEGDCNGVFVTNKTATGFDVVELQQGTSNAAFSYRIVCKRKFYEDERLASEEQDKQINTRMLNAAWPEVAQADQARRTEYAERAKTLQEHQQVPAPAVTQTIAAPKGVDQSIQRKEASKSAPAMKVDEMLHPRQQKH